MEPKIFIDGREGTTGLQIYQRLGGRKDIRLLSIEESLRKDPRARKEKINEELITYVEDRKGHDRRYAIAPDKIKKEVGWIPDTKFEDGIKMTIQWYLENPEWIENVTSGDYQKYYKDMYKSVQ